MLPRLGAYAPRLGAYATRLGVYATFSIHRGSFDPKNKSMTTYSVLPYHFWFQSLTWICELFESKGQLFDFNICKLHWQ